MATKKLVPPGYPPSKVGSAIKRNVSVRPTLNKRPVSPHRKKLRYGDQLPIPGWPFTTEYSPPSASH